MSHIVPIDGPIVVYNVSNPVTGQGKMTAGIQFKDSVRGKVRMHTFVDKSELNTVEADLIKAWSMQSGEFAVTITPGDLVTVACVVEFIASNGTLEGQVGTETPFIAKATPL